MVMLQPVAVALRTDRAKRNVMIQTRDIGAEDVTLCTAQLYKQLYSRIPAQATGPDICHGIQLASLGQGVYEAGNRRYVCTWRLLHEVLIVCIVPAGTCLLTAQRINAGVAQVLLLYCKAVGGVTMAKVFQKYAQIHASLAALVQDNGQDHQRAFLEGQQTIATLRGVVSKAKLSAITGPTTKEKTAARAGERALQDAVADYDLGTGPSAAAAGMAKGPALPPGVAERAKSAAGEREVRMGLTGRSSTKDGASGLLQGLSHAPVLPGFRAPEELLPNRLADPDGLLRPGERGSSDEEESEEEEEPEVGEPEAEEAEAEAEEAAVDEAPRELPGLGDPGDLSLLERWNACFVGPRLHAAATIGTVLCHRPELKCWLKLGVPMQRPVIDALERARVCASAFTSPLPEEPETEYDSDDSAAAPPPPPPKPAMRLALRRTEAAAAKGPARLIAYDLPAAIVPPPFLGCLQIYEVPTARVDKVGIPEWSLYIRVQVRASEGLPCGTVGGRLVVTLGPKAPPLVACSPAAHFVQKSHKLTFTLPAMASTGSFEARAHLSGPCGMTGPESASIRATVQLFGEPGGSTLSGVALLNGNESDTLDRCEGHYLCHLMLHPVVSRFKPPASTAVEDD